MAKVVGSLFAGIGGFDLAFERAGMSIAWQSEIDPKAAEVLARHWPSVPNLGDICAIDPATLQPVDVVCGGFPCQDLSIAGRRAGLAGEHSGLFYEIARLLDHLRPDWVVLENVPGLLSSAGGRDMGAVLGTLADLGYLGAGVCSTLSISEFPSDAAVCSLSAVLEMPPVPEKYFLSPKAAAGLLRRAEKRRLKLPTPLAAGLATVAGQSTSTA